MFHKKGKYEDLLYFVTTNKGYRFKFVHISAVLHQYAVHKQKNGCIFGKFIINNITDNRNTMYYTKISEKLNNGIIGVIDKSKYNYSIGVIGVIKGNSKINNKTNSAKKGEIKSNT